MDIDGDWRRNGGYRKLILRRLARLGKLGLDPGQIEALMRLEHPTLSEMPQWQFDDEVDLCAEVAERYPETAMECAKSFDL